MANEQSKELIPPNPGPSLAVSGEDSEMMRRALKGATTSRSAGMAHQAAEQQMARPKAPQTSKGNLFQQDKSENYGIRDVAPMDRK